MRRIKSPNSVSWIADKDEHIEAGEGIHDKDNKRTTINRDTTKREPFPPRGSLCVQGSSGKPERFTNTNTLL